MSDHEEDFAAQDDLSQHTEDEFMYDGNEEEVEDFGMLLSTFFTEAKKNRNIVDVLLEIKRSMETHNRILLKMCNHLTSQKQTN